MLPLVPISLTPTINRLFGINMAPSKDVIDKIFESIQTLRSIKADLDHEYYDGIETILRKFRAIAENVGKLDEQGLHPYERSETISKIELFNWSFFPK